MNPVRIILRWCFISSLLLVVGCGKPECQNVIREVVVSPDGKNKVVIFSRECGASTGENYQGSILKAGASLPDGAGNAFSMDQGEATVKWKDDGNVIVSVVPEAGGPARWFHQKGTVKEIRVAYEARTGRKSAVIGEDR